MLKLSSDFNINTFKSEYLFKKPFFIKKAFEPAPSYLQEFYKILFNPAYGAHGSLIQIRNQGTTIDPDVWSHTFPRDDGCYRDVAAIRKAIALKSSIIFDQYYRYSEEVKELVVFMQEQFNCASGCNAYLSQSGGAAFSAHRDCHHVLIFALSGKKRWRVYNAKQEMYQAYHGIDAALTHQEILDSGLCCDEVMQPGDLLYIPIGQFHAVENLSDNAFHLTLSMSFKPLFSMLEDILKKIYTPSQESNFSIEIKALLNEIHPAHGYDESIKEKEMLSSICRLSEMVEGIASRSDFLAGQSKIKKNDYLKVLTSPTDELIEEMLLCSQ